MTLLMRIPARRRVAVASRPLLAALLLLIPVTPLTAQRADFLFGRPHVTLAVMGGWAIPGEGSDADTDLFAFSRDELTVDRGDFASPFVMAEAALRVTERLDLAVGLALSGSTVPSEMRDWVTQDDAPIPQVTEFKRRRLMGGVRAYLFPRGRAISQFAWVPNSWSPYVGGGVGVTWYEFEQHGDFVDYETLDIFEGRFRTSGSGVTPYLAGGLDLSLSSHFLLRAEYRYIWGNGPVDNEVFVDFDDEIDLSSSRATLGFVFRT